jgi:hypothetical protein
MAGIFVPEKCMLGYYGGEIDLVFKNRVLVSEKD